MKKVFFFDIDGTLAINHHVPENNKKALALLKQQGYDTFICTGRAPFYAKNLFGDLVSGYICCNGRYILYHDQKFHGEAFSQKELDSYLQQFQSLELGALLVSDDCSMVYRLMDNETEAMKKEYGMEHICHFDSHMPVYTFDLFYRNLQKRDAMIAHFQDQLVINDHHGCGHCDCSTIGYDKGDAIAFILKYFHLSKDQAYAFGDGYNDQAMFREAGQGIAMGNAVKELKDKAAYITADVDQDGIIKALLHYGVIETSDKVEINI